MATASTQLPAESRVRDLAKPFEADVRGFAERLDALNLMELGPLKAHCAAEYLKECARYLDRVEKSELRTQATALDHAHKFLLRIIAGLTAPALALKKECRGVASDWERERQRRIAQQKLEQQAADIRAQEDARLAEAAALESQGRSDEAEAVLERPVVPSAAVVDENQGKVDGQAMVEVWVPAHDEKNNVVFASAEDRQAFLRWAAENIAFNYLLDVKYGALKKLLTDNRGLVQPPGLKGKVEHKFEPRMSKE